MNEPITPDATPVPPLLAETLIPPGGPSTEPFGETLAPSSDSHQSFPHAGFPAVPGYEIQAEIGRGGMGVVYKARQTALNRLVALKMILAGSHAGPEERSRFRAEAQAIAHLQHPGIVQVYDTGEHEGLPYFSLEFIGGGSLEKHVGGKPLEPRTAAYLVESLARAVHYAHQHGIIHRDLKPANVLLQSTRDEEANKKEGHDTSHLFALRPSFLPKVTDFGLAKQLDAGTQVTGSGVIMGTPSYMAPEQAQGKTSEIGPPCDIYALGGVLYELLTGRPPFRAATAAETLIQVITQEPAPPRLLRRDVPRDLDTICLKCLEKSPARRYTSAGELADDLARYWRGDPILARPVGKLERAWRWARRRPAAVLTALLLIVLSGAAAGGYHLWQNAERNRQERKRVEEAERSDIVAWIKHPEEEPEIGEPLTEEEAARTPTTYRVDRKNGKIERIEVRSGLGRLIRHTPYHHLTQSPRPLANSNEDDSLEAGMSRLVRQTKNMLGKRVTDDPLLETSYQYHRDETGALREIQARDPSGKVLWTVTVAAKDKIRYSEPAGANGYRDGEQSFLVDITRTDSKRSLWRIDAEGKRVSAIDSPSGVEAEYEGKDAETLRFFTEEGKPFPKTRSMRITRPVGPATIREEYRDAEGQPAMDWFGFYSRVLSVNAEGHLCFSGFNEAKEPVNGIKGYHQWVSKRDEKGREKDIEWYRTDGKPSNANGYARIRRTYNQAGIQIDTGLWVALSDGTFCLRERWDNNNRLMEYATFSDDGKPAAEDGKVHRETYEYDDKGNLLASRGYAADGSPATSSFGYHLVRQKFNDKGKLVEDAYFDSRNQPVIRTDVGYHRRSILLNSDGRLVEEAFFGKGGLPITAKAGYALRRWTYNLVDQLTEQQIWIAAPDGQLLLKERKDGKDRILEEATFARDGTPGINVNHFHRLINEYNPEGKNVLQRVLGTNGERVICKQGFHLWKARYDKNGNRLESAAFDTQDNPVLRADGPYHRMVQRFNEQSKVLEQSYFGTKGEPVNSEHGFTKRAWDYDSTGKFLQYRNWIVTKEGKVALTLHSDHRNFVLEEAVFDTEGKATVNKEGNHRTMYEYDEYNYRKIERYFGADGKPSLSTLGFHWTRTIRDAKGGWLDHKVYGLDDQPTTSKEGIHHWVWRRDDRGYAHEVRYFGTDEKLVDSKYGFARREYLYDEKGKPKDSVIYDSQGNRKKWDMTLVGNPVPGNAGAKAGLRVNDVVVRLDGHEVTSAASFSYLCETKGKEGKTLKLEILRDGKPMTLELPHGTHGVSFREKPLK